MCSASFFSERFSGSDSSSGWIGWSGTPNEKQPKLSSRGSQSTGAHRSVCPRVLLHFCDAPVYVVFLVKARGGNRALEYHCWERRLRWDLRDLTSVSATPDRLAPSPGADSGEAGREHS